MCAIQERKVPPPTAKTLTVRQFFSKKGLLSQWHPNYEYRDGQLQMAEAVESALAEKKHLIVEAGTGTGKTLAYLVPAILSGKRVVISTGTKNLQEQLFFKDIPFLEQHLGAAARLLHEGPLQLRLPPENLRRRKGAGARRPGRGRRFPNHPPVGEDHRKPATAPKSRRFPKAQQRLGQARRALRSLHRPEVPAVRALLHHR